MILKKCPACGKFFQYNGHARCPNCEPVADRSESDKLYNQRYRDKRSDKFYHSKEWRRLSRYVLSQSRYKCAICGGLATEVHHIVEVRDDWERRFDIDNLMPLCISCHNKQR